MLYDGAIKAVLTLRRHWCEVIWPQRGAALSKAISIIDEGLRPALDMQAGGEIAANLMALYDYCHTGCCMPTSKATSQSIDEVAHLMTELRDAWEALERQSLGRSQPSRTGGSARRPVRAALSYGRV